MDEGLVLGCESVGKTLLMKRLRQLANHESRGKKLITSKDPMAISSIHEDKNEWIDTNENSIEASPTIGIEIEYITLGKDSIVLREVGSAMLSMWHSYYQNSFFLIYVVDMSNITQLSQSVCEFFHILGSAHIRKNPILLILNKIDLPHTLSYEMIKTFFCLDELFIQLGNQFHVQAVSAFTGESIQDVLNRIMYFNHIKKE